MSDLVPRSLLGPSFLNGQSRESCENYVKNVWCIARAQVVIVSAENWVEVGGGDKQILSSAHPSSSCHPDTVPHSLECFLALHVWFLSSQLDRRLSEVTF